MRTRLERRRDYKSFLEQIKTEISSARLKAVQATNRLLVDLYWTIGKNLYLKIEVSKWGANIIEALAKDLQKEFPEIKGCSAQNLWRMKQVYETYKDNKKLSPLVRELGWTKNIIILHHTDTLEEREFYIKTCILNGWSKRELEHQMDSSLFERSILSKKAIAIPHSKKALALGELKEEYAFDLLNLKERFTEKEFRKSIINNLKNFFIEFGRYFTLVGEEYRINVGNDDYFIDLLFFNRKFKCFIATELKIGRFKPEYVGKIR
jgi:predicted nuclease of restriction endonuclease-like (RecB) superfamily